jgi:HAD superfamily hydrolase (TIGR01509 family)
VTTSSAEGVGAVLGHFRLKEVFHAVVTGDDVARHKPAPDAYQEVMARLGVTAPECLTFEDSDAGIESARAAGVRAVRVTF